MLKDSEFVPNSAPIVYTWNSSLGIVEVSVKHLHHIKTLVLSRISATTTVHINGSIDATPVCTVAVSS